MTAKHKVMTSLREGGVVAVIRTENPGDLVAVARALYNNGKTAEATMDQLRAVKKAIRGENSGKAEVRPAGRSAK